MDQFSTHIPVLAACFLVTNGPILELGSGNYSTLLLRQMCKVTGRSLTTVEWDVQWMTACSSSMPSSSWHTQILATENIENIPAIMETDWSVILLDHWPSWKREFDLPKIANKAELIVVHDSDQTNLNLGPVLETFKFQDTWKLRHPWTTVVSNRRPIDFL